MRDFHLPGRSTVHASRAMCATSHPLAALTAVELMRAGGSAADAAVGAALVLGACEPHMTGLGGDCFALVSPAGGGEVRALNGSGAAPAGADAARLRAEGHERMPVTGALPVTLPGAVAGLCALHAEYGRLPLAQVLAPAIAAFEEGVPVAPRAAFDWGRYEGRLEGAARRHFLLGGAAPRAGQVFRAPGQAAVLRRIADEGPAGFYEGEVAEDLLAALEGAGGAHTADDLAGVRAAWGAPIGARYGGVEVLEHPPNGQGAVALLMLRMAERLGYAALAPLSAERAHLEAEITKLAYDARDRLLGEGAGLERLMSDDLADGLAALVDPARALPDPRRAAAAVHKETVYLSVVDPDRMAVSLIYSIFHDFGSGLASDRFGVLFHNRGAAFSLSEGHPNELAPGRRPVHTILPGMTRSEGRLESVFGVMGGPYQPTGHLRVLSNRLDHGMDPQEALDAPRSFAAEGQLQVERAVPAQVRARLAEMGHDVHVPEGPIGGGQMIVLGSEGDLTGGSDPRKDGCALGY